MELIAWSLNAIDSIYSRRSRGAEEPWCPDKTFPAGYAPDPWGKWGMVCLNVWSVEDLYILGQMKTDFLLIGFGMTMVYRQVKSLRMAGASTPLLPVEITTAIRSSDGQNEWITMDHDTVGRFSERLSTMCFGLK